MATGYLSSLARQLTRRVPGSSGAAGSAGAVDPDATTAPPADPLAHRLAGAVEQLERPVTVPPHTLVAVFTGEALPRLNGPGTRLRPPWPAGPQPTEVLALTTAPVTLEVRIDRLTTLDDQVIEQTAVRVTVQLVADDDYRRAGELVDQLGSDLEAQLLRRVQDEVVSAATAAVRMNRLADVRQLTLTSLLAERWLPRTLAGGALVRRDVTVTELVWPDESTPTRSATAADGGPGGGEEFRLELDTDLARLWRRHADAELHGIAAAEALAETTVIAVATEEPGAYESSRLREVFGRHFADRHVHLVLAPADSYAELVASWFTQVDDSPGRLVSVESDHDEVLTITVDQAPATGAESTVVVGSAADRKALRRLVPHERVVFAAAGSTR